MRTSETVTIKKAEKWSIGQLKEKEKEKERAQTIDSYFCYFDYN